MSEWDLLVVGAGIQGVATAAAAAQAGARTMLIDRAALAEGPTGVSSAICRTYYTNPFLAEVARDAIDYIEQLDRMTGLRRTGALFLHPATDVDTVLRTCASLAATVPSTTPLEPSEIRTRFPDVETSGVAMGVWEPRAGYADPVGTARALFQTGTAAGLAHRFRSAVERVEPGEPPAVVLAGGERITAYRILLCAGPWTAGLCATFGVELPLRIEQHAVATLRVPPGQAALGIVLADCVNGFYGKPDVGDVYCVASLEAGTPITEPDTPTGRVPHAIAEDLYLRACDRLKPLREAGLTGGWTGLYDVSPDWQPVIGNISPGVFVHAGTSGHGFKLAPRLGQLVARLVLGEDADPRLQAFRPQRFEANELLAAGFGDVQVLG